MAYEADKVVVELIADIGKFDSDTKKSASSFDSSMNKIASSAKKAEDAVAHMTSEQYRAIQGIQAFAQASGKLSSATGTIDRSARQAQQRMRQLGFQIGDIGTQLSAGASPFIVLAQQGPQVANALDGTKGAAGRLATFLSNPWGAAILAAVSVLGGLILKHKDASESVDDLVQKLKEHAEKTRLSEEADRIWANTIDGLIDRQRKLNEELGKRLTTQAAIDRRTLRSAEEDRDRLQKELDDANKARDEAEQRLQAAKAAAPRIKGGQIAVEAAQSAFAAAQKRAADAQAALAEATSRVTRGTALLAEAQSQASTKAKDWSEALRNNIGAFIDTHPALVGFAKDLYGASGALEKGMEDAASAGVPFDDAGRKIDALYKRLSQTGNVKAFTTEIRKMAKALEDAAEAAKKVDKTDPVKTFKASVIGAEGTGSNRLGSSAAGFGQFMPSTWLSYFNRLFPDKAALSDAAKLGFRNVRAVAESVIDKATDDYVNVLKKAGQQITAANLYAVHLLGAKDAGKLFAAAPGAQTSSFLSSAVLKGNPFLQGTAKQAMAAIAKRIGDSSAAVSQGAAAIAQAMDQEKQREQAYQNEKANLEDRVLDARKALITSAEEIAKLELDAIDSAHDRYDGELVYQNSIGKLHDDELASLQKLNDERRDLLKEAVRRKEAERKFRLAEEGYRTGLDVQSGFNQAQQDLLQSMQGLAGSAKERRTLEQRILDLQFAEEKMRLQAQIALADRLKLEAMTNESLKAEAEAAAAAAEIAKARLETLDQRHANATQGNNQQNADPLQAYFQSIPNTAGEINDAFKMVAADGLQTFNDALAQAIINYGSLGDVGRAVLQSITADLVRLALQQIELHTIGAAMGTASIAATTAQAALAGAAWAGPAALASLATLGANAGPAAAALASTNALALVIGAPKAGGGRILGAGSDFSDNVLTPTSPNEFVINARSSRQVGYDTLEYINRHGQLPGFASGGRIRPMNVPAAAPGGRSSGFSADDIASLRGIVGDAIAAMPPINLYPTTDPADALDRALGTTRGRRRMFEFFAANEGRIKSQLNR